MIIALLRSSRFCTPVIFRGTSPLNLLRCASTLPVENAKPKKSIEELLKEELPQPYDGPERDHVNFPRRPRQDLPDKIRLGFLPEEWFQFFYKKTGVTGPYLFGVGLITFLVSKELYVLEHEFSTVVAMFIVVYTAIKKFGPAVKAYGIKARKEKLDRFNNMKEANMKVLEDNIAKEKKEMWCLEANSILMNAKRENVQMQLEAEFRRRQMHVYEQVKKRLDYHMDVANAQRDFEQKHMVNWIVDNVLRSITPQQEKETLQKCLSDLKTLAATSR